MVLENRSGGVTMKTRHFLAATAFVLVLGSQIGTADTDLNLWPVLTVEKDESMSDVRYLGPVGQHTTKEDFKIRALRPLYSWEKRANKKLSLDIAWPLTHYGRDADGNKWGHVFPVFWEKYVDGDRFLAVFPVFWSWWNRAKPYQDMHGWALLPLAWSASEYGTDVFHHGLFPLYFAGRDYKTECLWIAPYFQIQEEGKVTTRVVFPVYWATKYSNVLFPFYYSLDEGKLKLLFPFYGRYRGSDREWMTILWPGYIQKREEDYHEKSILWPLLTWGSDEAKERTNLHVVPLFGNSRRYKKTENGDRTEKISWALGSLLYSDETIETKSGETVHTYTSKRFAPFWGKDHSDSSGEVRSSVRDDVSVLWPLIFFGNSEQSNWTEGILHSSRHFHVLPFYISGTREGFKLSSKEEQGERTYEYYKNWLLPLYTYERNPEKRVFTMLWPLWLHSDGEDENQTSLLWRLVDAGFKPNGDRSVSVLWRGYRDEVRGNTRKVDAFPFITYTRTGQDRRFKFLEGFFESGREDGQGYLRFLYLPKIRFRGEAPRSD